MTYKRAKDLTIEVWTVLRDNPAMTDKIDIVDVDLGLYNSISNLKSRCPMCEVMDGYCKDHNGNFCPLVVGDKPCEEYRKWCHASHIDDVGNDDRAKAAGNIVKALQEWKPPRRKTIRSNICK